MCLGIPGKIISINNPDPIMRTGKVSFGGVVKEISLAYVPEADIGSYVIVHAGFAISILNEEHAQSVFSYLKAMDALDNTSEMSAERAKP